MIGSGVGASGGNWVHGCLRLVSGRGRGGGLRPGPGGLAVSARSRSDAGSRSLSVPVVQSGTRLEGATSRPGGEPSDPFHGEGDPQFVVVVHLDPCGLRRSSSTLRTAPEAGHHPNGEHEGNLEQQTQGASPGWR
jgi:hypothetical protein